MKSTDEKDQKARGRTLRSKLSDEFVRALSADFETNGAAVIEQVRNENPAVYVQVAAKLVPAESHVVNENASPYDSCRSTGELAEQLLLENGATTVSPSMIKKAITELERHGKAIEVIANGNKPEKVVTDPNNEKDRLMREARRVTMPWAPTN